MRAALGERRSSDWAIGDPALPSAPLPGRYSLNIAIAVPPEVTLTERLFVAPEGGLQLTE